MNRESLGAVIALSLLAVAVVGGRAPGVEASEANGGKQRAHESSAGCTVRVVVAHALNHVANRHISGPSMAVLGTLPLLLTPALYTPHIYPKGLWGKVVYIGTLHHEQL